MFQFAFSKIICSLLLKKVTIACYLSLAKLHNAIISFFKGGFYIARTRYLLEDSCTHIKWSVVMRYRCGIWRFSLCLYFCIYSMNNLAILLLTVSSRTFFTSISLIKSIIYTLPAQLYGVSTHLGTNPLLKNIARFKAAIDGRSVLVR